MKIFEIQRDLGLKESQKQIELELAKEKARIVGGEKEAIKVEEDYDVK